MKKILIILQIIIILVCCYSFELDNYEPNEEIPALADSLSLSCVHIKHLVDNYNMSTFLKMIDPEEAKKLKRIAFHAKVNDKMNYIRTGFVNLPNIDTLKFYDLTNTEDFVRLTYIGDGTSYSRKQDYINYSFFLFHRHNDFWKFLAYSSLEKQRQDFYGHKLTYHETDLPPRFRFPKISI